MPTEAAPTSAAVSAPGSVLEPADFPPGTTKVFARQFTNRHDLVSVRLPEGVAEIETQAFHCCTRLRELHLPSTLTTIGSYAFSACYELCELRLPPLLVEVDASAFDGCPTEIIREDATDRIFEDDLVADFPTLTRAGGAAAVDRDPLPSWP